MSDLPLRCACGKLHGTARNLSPKSTNHCVCYCGDCQAFARYLGRDDIMNEWGGTSIVQMAPAMFQLEAQDTLACMRLSPKGLYRYYCDSCKTPVGNTLSPGIPFVGVPVRFFTATPDSVVGPAYAHVQTKSALNGGPPYPNHDLSAIARMVRRLAKWKITGGGKPNPFFDDVGKAPVTPHVLTLEQRKAL